MLGKKDQIIRILKERSQELLNQPYKFITFTNIPEADQLINNIQEYPHAFVLGCLMDRQMKSEKCWIIPYKVKENIGSFDISELGKLNISDFERIFRGPPPLHRLFIQMAEIFELAVTKIITKYHGNAEQIWNGNPSSATIVRRFLEFKGVGPKIATMAANILTRDFKIPVINKFSIDISPDTLVKRTFKRLGLIEKKINENQFNGVIIYTARELNPEYPGIFDLGAWEIGKKWCNENNPNCKNCIMTGLCPSEKLF